MATKYKLSKEDIKQEIIRCGRDPIYFIDNYAKINHPMHGLIALKTYDYQKQLLKDYNDHRFNIILKARQLGISTVTAAYISWLMMFHRGKNILVIATKLDVATNLIRHVKNIFKYLPSWIKISEIKIDNATSLELENGSHIKASATNVTAGRSEALSLLVIDEAAHIDGMSDIWTAVYSTISTGGRCVALSSPNGCGNWFHHSYVDALAGRNNFFPTELLWSVHPDRDQAWFENETRNMSKRQIAQELLCSFNMSGETVFDATDIERISKTIKEPVIKSGFDRNIWIWEEFKNNNSYSLIADVSRGDGKDYSVFHVLKLNTMEVVAEYQGKATPDIFSNIILQVGRDYGNCMVVVENNSIGFAVLEKLKELKYPNIYHSTKTSHEFIDQFEAENTTSAVAGFATSSRTRPLIIAKLEEFVRNQVITIYSLRTLDEMKTFIWNGSRPEAMRGYNDDLIMALAIACWVRDTALTTNTKELEYKKAFLDCMSIATTSLNTRIPGMSGCNSSDTFKSEAKQQMAEYMWFYKG